MQPNGWEAETDANLMEPMQLMESMQLMEPMQPVRCCCEIPVFSAWCGIAEAPEF